MWSFCYLPYQFNKCHISYWVKMKQNTQYGSSIVPLIMKKTFFKVNTKYISSSVLKTSEFSRVHGTSENFKVFNSRDEINYVFTDVTGEKHLQM